MNGPRFRLRGLLARPVLANSVALVALRATNLLARLLLLFAIARQVTPTAFGTVVLVMSVAEIGKVLADFGLDTLAIREYSAAAPPPASPRRSPPPSSCSAESSTWAWQRGSPPPEPRTRWLPA